MSTTDYIIDIALILVVLLQIREHEITNRSLIRPLLILGVAFATYLRSVPTAGNDLLLAGVLTIVGVVLGIASGSTAIFGATPEGAVTVRSGWVSVSFWVLGMGSRFAFVYWITHSGSAWVVRFSMAHSISSSDAWTVALLAMAAGQVICRISVLALRRRARARAAVAGARSLDFA